jgi:hypothetical protein
VKNLQILKCPSLLSLSSDEPGKTAIDGHYAHNQPRLLEPGIPSHKMGQRLYAGKRDTELSTYASTTWSVACRSENGPYREAGTFNSRPFFRQL